MAFSRTRTTQKTAIPLLILVAFLVTSSRGAIFWQSFPSLENKNFLSDGSWMPDGFTFCLGSFEADFDPAPENASEWHANWNAAGFAVFSKDRFNAFSQLTLMADGASFPAGGQAYIWGYNSAGEWILLKNEAWQWPAAQQPEPSISWSTDQDTTVVVGEIGSAKDAFHLKTQRIGAGANVPLLTPQDWRETQFGAAQLDDPEISGWQADPDADGLSNLMEFALGGMPFSDDRQTSATRFGFETVGDKSYLTLEITKPPHMGIDYAIEVSSDLVHWKRGNPHTVIIEDSGAMLRVRDAVATDSMPRRFIRFSVQPN